LDPAGHTLLIDHQLELGLQILEVFRMEEDVGNAWANSQLQVAELDPNLLHCACPAQTENAEIGYLKPLLPVVAVSLLKCIEKIDTDFWRLGF